MNMNDDSSLQLRIDEIADEYLLQLRNGDSPSVERFIESNPDIAEPLRATLLTIKKVNELKESEVSGFGKSRARQPAPLPSIPDFQLLRPLGEGGMGVVYEAVQETLGRRVALKVLPASLAEDSKYVQRFQREARSAAKLHHTNIVPVFDVGSEGDTLYYAMQFIDGHSLDVICKEVAQLRDSGERFSDHSLSKFVTDSSSSTSKIGSELPYFKSIAQIGVSVAEALQYAHERKIVHRDVKPSNLILDRRGVVWLADFGLVKTFDSELTATGDILGTIRYMAPEGFRGHADPASDVYSLGVTLFELVTLTTPYDASNRAQLMQKILEKEPRRPRDIEDRIPVDLETIILKAIDKSPARRYASAGELADDLRRFLEDQPVLARRASAVECGLRWMKRNLAQTIAMISMAIAIVVLLVATGWVLQQKRISDQNRHFAEQQKQVAQENFQLASDAVNRFFTQVSEEKLLDAPGMELLRRDLLSSAGDFYTELAEREQHESQIQAEYVAAIYRKAIITSKIDSVDDAILQLQSLVDDVTERPFGDSLDFQYRMARVHQALGTLIGDQGDLDTGYQHQQRALEYIDQLLEAEPNNWEYQQERSVTLGKQVRFFGDRGQFDEAMALAKEALAGFDALDLEQINNSNLWMNRGLAVRVIGALNASTGDYKSAISCFLEAADAYERALALKPRSALLQRYIGNAYGDASTMHNRIGQSEEAFNLNLQAIEVLEKLAADYPQISGYKHDLGNRYADLAIAYWYRKDYQAAKREALVAMEYREELASDFPSQVDYQVRLARIYQNIGLFCGNLKDEAEKEVYHRKAIGVLEQVCEDHPESPRYVSDLSRCRTGLADLFVEQGRMQEAKELIDASWEMILNRYRSDSAVVELGVAVAEATVTRGEFLMEQTEYELAIETFNTGLEIGMNTLERASENIPLKRQLWAALLDRGECRVRNGNLELALEDKRTAVGVAIDDYRKCVAEIQMCQVTSFQGGETPDHEGFVSSIDPLLLEENGRLHLELAYLVAAETQWRTAQTQNEQELEQILTQSSKHCEDHLQAALDGQAIDADDLARTLKHPYFERLSGHPGFSKVIERLSADVPE